MRREILTHLSFLISFFIFISLFKGWVDFGYWPFWLGGLIGTLLPDIDHFIYVYFLKPHELTSQRVRYLAEKREIFRTFQLLAETREERRSLIFHTAPFQILFFLLAFLVITSSGSLFGAGLVLGFMLHLSVDQLVDYFEGGSLANWFSKAGISLDKRQQLHYMIAVILATFILTVVA